MRETCHEVLKSAGHQRRSAGSGDGLEHIALSDPYFIEKKLYPNVDFYSGIIPEKRDGHSVLHVHRDLRHGAYQIGWIAHWNEMRTDWHENRRPRQLYAGFRAARF
ncbi:hypothetical protein KCP71_23760 [Salmonella enterica subsp. enterica]|nr:hypothetical protein KCP71_23760 [Salmonella enterica subsp. enterica]